MSLLLCFLSGFLLGSLCGVVCLCLVQIGRLTEGKGDDYANPKRTDTFPLE